MRTRFFRYMTLFAGLAACTHPLGSHPSGLGAGGGSVKTQDEEVTLQVPPGALSTPQTITIVKDTSPAPAGYDALGPVYLFHPDGLVFKSPVTVSVAFNSATATSPTIYWSNANGGYDPLPTTVAGGIAQAQVTHFSSGFVANASSSSKALTAFSLASPAATGVIDESAKTVSLTVPIDTVVTALVASFTTTGASVTIGSATQTSGTSPNDFTNPVTYTVVAADASTADYEVTVTVAACSCVAGQICNSQGQCVCDPTCGGCLAGFVCNPDTCECVQLQQDGCSAQAPAGLCPASQICLQGQCEIPLCSQTYPNGQCSTGGICCNADNQATLSCPNIGQCVCDTTCGGDCPAGQVCNTTVGSNFCGLCECDVTCGGVACPVNLQCDSSPASGTCGQCL